MKARRGNDPPVPEPSPRREPFAQVPSYGQLPTVFILALGLILSALGFNAARRAALAPAEDEFQRTALHLTGVIRYAFTENIEALHSVGALYASSEEVTREEFHAFASVILDEHTGVRALSWAPQVEAAARTRFESAAAADRPGFVITARSPDGSLRSAPPDREVFPVLFLEPLRGNEPALGFDLSSETARRATLEAAAESGELLATPRLHLVQENGSGFGVLFVLPVYQSRFVPDSPEQRRAGLQGFLTAVVSLPRTLDLAVRDFPAERADIVLCDLSAPPGRRLLWARTSAGTPDESSCEAAAEGARTSISSLEVGGRSWSLRVSAGPLVVGIAHTWPAWVVLAFGILLTLVLVAHLYEGRLHSLALVQANYTLNQEVGERKDAEQRLTLANRELERLSREDPLMGVANRRRVDEFLGQEWQRATRSGASLALILMDIDHFKQFNDNYGHVDGDECLRRVAQAAAGALSRPADLIGRFGGDELAVVLPETGLDGALAVARRIHDAVGRLAIPHAHSPTASTVTVSGGVGATVPLATSSLLAFTRAVDNALYTAKAAGRNRVTAADDAPPASTT